MTNELSSGKGSEAKVFNIRKLGFQDHIEVPACIEGIENEERLTEAVARFYKVVPSEKEHNRAATEKILPRDVVENVREQYQLKFKLVDVLKLQSVQIITLTVLVALGFIKLPMAVFFAGMSLIILWLLKLLAKPIKGG